MLPFTSTLTSAISSPEGTYHYSLARTGAHLAVISSDDHIRVIDPSSLAVLSGSTSPIHDDGVTCLKSLNEARGDIVATAGRDGAAKLWDLRQGFGTPVKVFRRNGGPILSLDACEGRGLLAVGTELTGTNAEVVVWDLEGCEKMTYVESHNDDVTHLSFHPTTRELLLSGSTDGLVNIYNMTITDEDEALHQVINHGSSIHHAGFLNDTAIYGLSHDEVLSVYKLADPDEDVEEPAPVNFGDVRGVLGCDYAIDVLLRGRRSSGTGILVVGSHERQWVDLHSLKIGEEGKWGLGGEEAVRLVGGHGEEVVRCLYLDDASATVFTGGEDGLVKAWKPAS
ncbi:hypothetical protein H072_6124 [Dactylellina haptotyla CBS 200.50]|uniref:Anaphase-promoting complex subunit 4 WD40 domain-containing protein n=1 Tax=Dactylellina haptotyla (strain CBS 200.50) TaxID=1284197 RepID=S8AAU9_DACHA|nr:hypothetical protein H072_6124 [Dactylellina haptotyla CBS 200.50]